MKPLAKKVHRARALIVGLCFSAALAGCGGGSSSAPATPADPGAEAPVTPTPPPEPPPVQTPVPEPAPGSSLFRDQYSTSRFLSTATFGARGTEIDSLTGTNASDWFLAQLGLAPSLYAPIANQYFELADNESFLPFSPTTMGFWRLAVEAPDQLRQRMSFALSQIMVASDFGGELLSDFPSAINYYVDVLVRNSLGNYRDLLEEITYTPAMGHYLTYMGNLPADDATGRMPDENYAREILQLFTIGLVELNSDGTARTDAQGSPLETYSNADITGLARVFTGLNLREPRDNPFEEERELSALLREPMVMFEEDHSQREKTFLGLTIPAGTPGRQSITMALDHIMAHPNVGPFIGRQLIQRFTQSNPSPAYVAEVAQAFDSGRYVLPDNTIVGDGRKGDLGASLAAVLFSPEAQRGYTGTYRNTGKLREPVLRFTQWARAFEVDTRGAEYLPILYDTMEYLEQHPFRSRSVFNFYRPGYVAPGTQSGVEGMTVPELQIVNASTIPGYVNFMTFFAFAAAAECEDVEEIREEFDEFGYPYDEDAACASFVPDYGAELLMASDPATLTQHLNLLLAHGDLSAETEANIVAALQTIPIDFEDEEERDSSRLLRVAIAVLMTMTAPEYLVQR